MDGSAPNRINDPTAELYGGLQSAYDFINREVFEPTFGFLLPNCMITLRASGRTLGYFWPDRFLGGDGEFTHEIAVNPGLFNYRSIDLSLSVVAHEMVHLLQFVDGSCGRTGYHNKEFANRMEQIGLIASTTGKADGARTGQSMSHYIDPNGLYIQKIREFLVDGFRRRWGDRFAGSLTMEWTPEEAPLPPTLSTSSTPAAHPERDGAVARPAPAAEYDSPYIATLEHAPDDQPGHAEPADPAFVVRQPAVDHTASWIPDSSGDLPAPADAPLAVLHPDKLLPPSQAAKRPGTTRLKFTCPVCESNAWGKPNLFILCGHCTTHMKPVTADAGD